MMFARLDLQQQGEMLQLQFGKARKSCSAQLFGSLLSCLVAAAVGYLTFKTDGLIFMGSCFVFGLGVIGALFKNEPLKKFKREWAREIASYNQAVAANRRPQQPPPQQMQQQQMQQQQMRQQPMQQQEMPSNVKPPPQIPPPQQVPALQPKPLQPPRPAPPRSSTPVVDGQAAFQLDLGFDDKDDD